jgi:hypothetical protein
MAVAFMSSAASRKSVEYAFAKNNFRPLLRFKIRCPWLPFTNLLTHIILAV